MLSTGTHTKRIDSSPLSITRMSNDQSGSRLKETTVDSWSLSFKRSQGSPYLREGGSPENSDISTLQLVFVTL